MVADELEFDGIVANSLDSSSDRDFVLEFAFVPVARSPTHLSGWAEEWILWSTTEFGFLRLPQEFCTGSSIMPQKINPDVLELIRGKTGRVVGNLMSLLGAREGPAAGLQPRPAGRQGAAVRLGRHGGRLPGTGRRRSSPAPSSIAKRSPRGSNDGYLDATTLMEHLIMQGVPQRTAHEIIGRLVAAAMKRGVPLAELPLEEFQAAHASLDESCLRRARRRPRRRSVHQLRLHESRTSRTPTRHLARTTLTTTRLTRTMTSNQLLIRLAAYAVSLLLVARSRNAVAAARNRRCRQPAAARRQAAAADATERRRSQLARNQPGRPRRAGTAAQRAARLLPSHPLAHRPRPARAGQADPRRAREAATHRRPARRARQRVRLARHAAAGPRQGAWPRRRRSSPTPAWPPPTPRTTTRSASPRSSRN